MGPDIVYATHQCAQLFEEPRALHGAAVKSLDKYVSETKNDGPILDPEKDQRSEVYADSYFIGNYHKPIATKEVITTKSRTGYKIM